MKVTRLELAKAFRDREAATFPDDPPRKWADLGGVHVAYYLGLADLAISRLGSIRLDRGAILRVMREALPASHKMGLEINEAADAILKLQGADE